MTTPTQTDLQKAVENVQPTDLADNLDPHHKPVETPEDLDKTQSTPFIDNSIRTDK